jgi:hypothetical protein
MKGKQGMRVLVNYYQSKGRLICKYYEPCFASEAVVSAEYEKDYGDDFVITNVNGMPTAFTKKENADFIASEKERLKKQDGPDSHYAELAVDPDGVHIHICKDGDECIWFGLLDDDSFAHVGQLVLQNGRIVREQPKAGE